ncbi:MAG TPA: DEAD/DEAH box helicase [Gammaproteobacteria bacterium]|nr:DEAD/DEAH box helicase [Gammaproteobacteria bacterium]
MFSSLLFSELLLDDPLLEAIEALGFNEMSEVQLVAIPPALEGHDLIVNARTGSGKTLAYLVPMLQQILDNPQPATQALILAPTRELCRQIAKQCDLLTRFTEITYSPIIGGEDPKYQIEELRMKPDIIIATPGRLLEHVKREVISLDSVSFLVLDEADRMLDLGFAEDVIRLAKQCNEDCQHLLFSASYNPKKFAELTSQIMDEPEEVIIDSARQLNENIALQKILADNNEHKLALCEYLLKHENYTRTIVFANKKETVNRICGWLQSKDINTAFIHGDIEQEKRNQQMRKFRNGEVRIIVATDLASRGLDVSELDLIINYDVPRNGEDFLHRVGRTGRMENNGTAITLIDANEWNSMVGIENFLRARGEFRRIEGLEGNFRGPEKLKKSGKAYGAKRRKAGKKDSVKKKTRRKNRVRDRRNIGKRRKPATDE